MHPPDAPLPGAVAPLPGFEAALIGLAALAVMMIPFLWPMADQLNVMAHEGAPAQPGPVHDERDAGGQVHDDQAEDPVRRVGRQRPGVAHPERDHQRVRAEHVDHR